MPITRTRTRGGFTPTLISHVQTSCNGTVLTTSATSGSLLTRGTFEYMTDVVTPGFRKIQKAGGTVFTSMEKTKEVRTASEGACTRTRIGGCTPTQVRSVQYSSVNDYQLGLPQYLANPEVSSMEAEARTKALANAKTPNVMGLVDIAEARSTVVSLAKSVENLRRVFLAIGTGTQYVAWLKRNNAVRSPASLYRFISSNWLQYRYMFVPLMLTANSVLEAYRTSRKPPGFRETFRSSVTNHITKSEESFGTVFNGLWTTKLYATRSVTTTVRGGCLQEVITAKCLSTELGLDPAYIGQALWEITTLSFVIDWFINIGDFVAAVSPDVGSKILGTWTTTTTKSTTTWRTTNVYGDTTGWVTSGGASSGTAEKTTVLRQAGGTASLTLKTFQGKWIDFIHLTDAIALLASSTKSSSR